MKILNDIHFNNVRGDLFGGVTAAIIAADEIAVGQGAGPLHHFHALWPQPDRRSR